MTVYVVDGWDELTQTAFCEVFKDEKRAIKLADKIFEEYAQRAEDENMFFDVGVIERKVQ